MNSPINASDSPEDARELFELAKAQNTFLMEALWSKHLPAFTKVTELIQRGEIGPYFRFNPKNKFQTNFKTLIIQNLIIFGCRRR